MAYVCTGAALNDPTCCQCGKMFYDCTYACATYEDTPGHETRLVGCDNTAIYTYCSAQFGYLPKLSWYSNLPATGDTRGCCTYHPPPDQQETSSAQGPPIPITSPENQNTYSTTDQGFMQARTEKSTTKPRQKGSWVKEMFAPKDRASMSSTVKQKTCYGCGTAMDHKAAQYSIPLHLLTATRKKLSSKIKYAYFHDKDCYDKTIGQSDKVVNALPPLQTDEAPNPFEQMGHFGQTTASTSHEGEAYTMNLSFSSHHNPEIEAASLPGHYPGHEWDRLGQGDATRWH